MKLFQNPIFIICICLVASCKEEYQPKIKSGEQSILVVEGILNSNGPTTIKLTRTVKLSDTVKVQPETGALLIVESESGSINTTFEEYPDAGSYHTLGLVLDPAQKYRLRITTSDQKLYVSDFVSVHQNPPIDSVNWTRDTAGVTIYVNTHDPQNNTRYYRWEFDETWEINSRYYVRYTDDGLMEPFYPGEDLYHCWKYYNSSNLILGTTNQLSSDVIFEKPLIKIKSGDDRLSVRYSVLVRQYALDKQGYEFYQLMKKNTESLGSIFDAQPTEITGNVHAISNPSVPVIGYITANSVDTARLWITSKQVPYWPPWADCSQNLRLNSMTDDIASYTAAHEWLVISSDMNGNVYLGRAPCVSCRLRGGSTHKPAWW